MSETGDKVVSDEERVRAALPDAKLISQPITTDDNYEGIGYMVVWVGLSHLHKLWVGTPQCAWAVALRHPRVVAFEAQHRPASQPEDEPITPCIDCGRPYPHGLDFVLTWKQWDMITPDDDGVLCPSCMVNRAAKLPTAIAVYGCIIFGNIDPDAVLECIIEGMRLENADYCRETRELRHELARLRASIKPEALEDAKVTWRVETRRPEQLRWYQNADVLTQAQAERIADGFGGKFCSTRVSRLTQEVVAVREAGK